MEKILLVDLIELAYSKWGEKDPECSFKVIKKIMKDYWSDEDHRKLKKSDFDVSISCFQHYAIWIYCEKDEDDFNIKELIEKFNDVGIPVKIIGNDEYNKNYLQVYLVFLNNENEEDVIYSLSKILSNFKKDEYKQSMQNNGYYLHKELFSFENEKEEKKINEIISDLELVNINPIFLSKFFYENAKDEVMMEFIASAKEENLDNNSNSRNTVIKPIQNAKPLDLSMSKIKTFDSFFANKIVGQDKPIELVKQLLISLLYDLDENRKRPAGVFFFTGPTGVGKTELAKALNEFLYNNQNLNRLDMSEYKSEMAIQKLIGAPHGLVGYEEGGVLINLMKANPNSIILFDEIEKADKTVFDIFLQILDEGFVTSNKGEKVFFNNNIIIFTSNIGANYITNKMSNNKIEQIIKQAINEFFNYELNRPEILGRIGMENIVCFNMINKKEDLFKILDIHFNKFIESLNSKKIKLTFNREQVYNSILLDVDPTKGARDIRNEFEVFKKHFNKALFENELDLDALKNKTINFTYDNVKVKITKLTNNK